MLSAKGISPAVLPCCPRGSTSHQGGMRFSLPQMACAPYTLDLALCAYVTISLFWAMPTAAPRLPSQAPEISQTPPARWWAFTRRLLLHLCLVHRTTSIRTESRSTPTQNQHHDHDYLPSPSPQASTSNTTTDPTPYSLFPFQCTDPPANFIRNQLNAATNLKEPIPTPSSEPFNLVWAIECQ